MTTVVTKRYRSMYLHSPPNPLVYCSGEDSICTVQYLHMYKWTHDDTMHTHYMYIYMYDIYTQYTLTMHTQVRTPSKHILCTHRCIHPIRTYNVILVNQRQRSHSHSFVQQQGTPKYKLSSRGLHSEMFLSDDEKCSKHLLIANTESDNTEWYVQYYSSTVASI